MKKNVIIIICGLILLSGIYACPIYRIFGIPCPTCGTTRACRLFLSGHFKDAFLMHPLFWLPAVFIFKPFRKRKVLIAVLILYIAVYILRMSLMFPDIEPMKFNYDSILGGFFK